MPTKPLNFKVFNEDFFTIGRMLDVVWFGRKGVIKYKSGLIAEITLSTNGKYEHYEGYKVKILRKELKATGNFFSFKDYMSYLEDIPCSNGVHISENCCKYNGVVKFYSNTNPKEDDIKKMVQDIKKFISMYEGLKGE